MYIVITIILLFFFSSLVIWFVSGFVKRRNPKKAQSLDRMGGYLFMSSLAIAIFAVILWFAILS